MQFDDGGALAKLTAMEEDELDALPYGVVGMDLEGTVLQYNRFEADFAGLSKERVTGANFFEEVAPCTNNFMVAGRFEDEIELDDRLNYTFTVRMKPTKVELRLLKSESRGRQYLLVRLR